MTEVPSLRDLIDAQRHLVASLQQRETNPEIVSAPNALASAIDKLSTLERLAADIAKDEAQAAYYEARTGKCPGCGLVQLTEVMGAA